MGEGAFEEWDSEFLDQLIFVEELALSATVRPQPSSPPNNIYHTPSEPPIQPWLPPPDSFDFSPPKQMSQRFLHQRTSDHAFPGFLDFNKESEIERLKMELGKVSKQLSDLEKECVELKKEKNNCDVDIRLVPFDTQKKDEKLRNHFPREHRVNIVKQSDKFLHNQETGCSYEHHVVRSSKTVGIQTDTVDEFHNPVENYDRRFLYQSLDSIWGSTSCYIERELLSKLLVSCPKDLNVLFGLDMSIYNKMSMGSQESKIFLDAALHPMHPLPPIKASESILMKLINGMTQVDVFINILLDFCHVDNVLILQSSLRVLHAVLLDISVPKNGSQRRERVIVNTSDLSSAARHSGDFSSGNKSSCAQLLWNQDLDNLPRPSVNPVEWHALFESMRQIAVKSSNEHVKLESVSIMNLILLRTDAVAEREIFGQQILFDSIAKLLKKDNGLRVPGVTVRLLFLLLNCPKLLGTFCICAEKKKDENCDNAYTSRELILDRLAYCLDRGSEDPKLRKDVISLLAFIASSGKPGIEILLTHDPSGRPNFLFLILQVLQSDMDFDIKNTVETPDSIERRRMMVREGLIFLNRSVSNPTYSAMVLRVLTGNRDMASLTVDTANRLCRKDVKNTEIVELAKVLRRRLYAYLGQNTS